MTSASDTACDNELSVIKEGRVTGHRSPPVCLGLCSALQLERPLLSNGNRGVPFLPLPFAIDCHPISRMATEIHPVPPPNADLATTWAFLKEGLDHIMTKPQHEMSYLRYMALSTASYNYCTSPSPIREFLKIHPPSGVTE